MNHHSRQSGSAFFIILVAIALFAALSYAVFRGGNASQATLSNDQARLAAQEIIGFGDTLAKTVQTLMLRGCSEKQFDFSNSVWTRVNGTPRHWVGENPTAVIPNCSVFVAGGGNMQPLNLPVPHTDGVISPTSTNTMRGSGRVVLVSMPGIGETNKQELAFQFPRINPAVCLKINEILGIPNPGGEAPNSSVTNTQSYNGIYTDTGAGIAMTDLSGLLVGKSAFCTKDNTSYFKVLITR